MSYDCLMTAIGHANTLRFLLCRMELSDFNSDILTSPSSPLWSAALSGKPRALDCVLLLMSFGFPVHIVDGYTNETLVHRMSDGKRKCPFHAAVLEEILEPTLHAAYNDEVEYSAKEVTPGVTHTARMMILDKIHELQDQDIISDLKWDLPSKPILKMNYI